MAEFFEHPVNWIKAHPYISVGAAVGGVVLVWALWPSSSSAQSNLTPQQQMAMQRLVGSQQLRALQIQNRPALAAIQSQNYATRWQGRLGSQSISEQTTLANIQAQELASQQAAMSQSTGYLAWLQYLIGRMSYGFSPQGGPLPANPGGGGNAFPSGFGGGA